ncbi:MAG: hypothetical protein QM726_20490 [Chitinophagaceae bacterium]
MKLTGLTSVCLLCSLLILSSNAVCAQSSAEDSILYQKAVYNAIGLYHQEVGDQSGLFNGSQYGAYPFPFEENGFVFFNNPKPGIGTVTYDGILYENVQLQFDEVQEVVIMQDSSRRIQLLNPRIQAFSLFNNNFVRIIKDSSSRVLPKTGFYNLLYAGKTLLYKREEKTIREEVGRTEVVRFIDVSRNYYVQKNNQWFSVKGKNGILDVFEDRKKELRQFIRKNNLSYKKDRDNMLAKVTAYYDQLTR